MQWRSQPKFLGEQNVCLILGKNTILYGIPHFETQNDYMR